MDLMCPQYQDASGHAKLRRHTCRAGPRCTDTSAEHRRAFLHVPSFEGDAIEEVFIDFAS
jgi:hypothetical protein